MWKEQVGWKGGGSLSDGCRDMAMLDASSSMPQLHSSTAPLVEQQPTEWTSDAPQATERVRRSAGDWMGWLFALALLAFFALFGFRMMLQALAGGWQ